MGMANSDDEAQIRRDHDLMEKIKELHPDYHGATHNMTEDHRIIYDHQLREKFRELFGDTRAWDNDRR